MQSHSDSLIVQLACLTLVSQLLAIPNGKCTALDADKVLAPVALHGGSVVLCGLCLAVLRSTKDYELKLPCQVSLTCFIHAANASRHTSFDVWVLRTIRNTCVEHPEFVFDPDAVLGLINRHPLSQSEIRVFGTLMLGAANPQCWTQDQFVRVLEWILTGFQHGEANFVTGALCDLSRRDSHNFLSAISERQQREIWSASDMTKPFLNAVQCSLRSTLDDLCMQRNWMLALTKLAKERIYFEHHDAWCNVTQCCTRLLEWLLKDVLASMRRHVHDLQLQTLGLEFLAKKALEEYDLLRVKGEGRLTEPFLVHAALEDVMTAMHTHEHDMDVQAWGLQYLFFCGRYNKGKANPITDLTLTAMRNMPTDLFIQKTGLEILQKLYAYVQEVIKCALIDVLAATAFVSKRTNCPELLRMMGIESPQEAIKTFENVSGLSL
jgi:hypothetical protein